MDTEPATLAAGARPSGRGAKEERVELTLRPNGGCSFGWGWAGALGMAPAGGMGGVLGGFLVGVWPGLAVLRGRLDTKESCGGAGPKHCSAVWLTTCGCQHSGKETSMCAPLLLGWALPATSIHVCSNVVRTPPPLPHTGSEGVSVVLAVRSVPSSTRRAGGEGRMEEESSSSDESSDEEEMTDLAQIRQIIDTFDEDEEVGGGVGDGAVDVGVWASGCMSGGLRVRIGRAAKGSCDLQGGQSSAARGRCNEFFCQSAPRRWRLQQQALSS